ncbi:hypothetical protein QCA50_011014 [Cerrena zonata]|uniref:Alcohol acetyltransferase n=1 Tax=Cerrena zonata TaxID=2478898 RepID=A0AAW0G3G1_9APHY
MDAIKEEATSTVKSRDVGLFEKYHVVRAHLRADTGVIMTARYIGPKSLEQNELYAALGSVLQKHRALSTQVHDADTDRPYYVSLKSVDLSQVVHFHGSDEISLEAVIDSYLVNRFEYGSPTPLWRLGVMTDNTLIFHYDHCIGDGQSGVAFHSDLLDALNTVSSNSEVESSTLVLVPDILKLQPALEDAMKVSLSFIKIFWLILSMIVPARWQKSSSTWTGNVVSRRETSTRVRTRLWTISPDQADRLLKICRAHKTTITSFIYVIGIAALSKLLEYESAHWQYRHLAVVVPVSLRRFTKSPLGSFCDHVGGISWFPLIPGGPSKVAANPWNTAANHTTALRKQVPKAAEDIALLKLLGGKYVPYFEGMFGKKRSTTLEISNVGRFPSNGAKDKGEGGWQIEDMFFGQSNAIFGSAFKLSAVGSQNGSLGLCVNWTEGVVEEDVAQRFVDCFREFTENAWKVEI